MTRNENCHLYRNKANICKGWTPIKPLDRSFSVSRFHTVNRWQFPVRLAGAKTFHRVQGDTTNAAVCDFSEKCGNGLVYIRLSCSRSIGRLYVKSFNEKKIHVEQWVHEEMLSLESRMIPLVPYVDADKGFYVTFLNAQSLHAHIQDVTNDFRFTRSHVLAFCETRYHSSEQYEISGFSEVVRRDNSED